MPMLSTDHVSKMHTWLDCTRERLNDCYLSSKPHHSISIFTVAHLKISYGALDGETTRNTEVSKETTAFYSWLIWAQRNGTKRHSPHTEV